MIIGNRCHNTVISPRRKENGKERLTHMSWLAAIFLTFQGVVLSLVNLIVRDDYMVRPARAQGVSSANNLLSQLGVTYTIYVMKLVTNKELTSLSLTLVGRDFPWASSTGLLPRSLPEMASKDHYIPWHLYPRHVVWMGAVGCSGVALSRVYCEL